MCSRRYKTTQLNIIYDFKVFESSQLCLILARKKVTFLNNIAISREAEKRRYRRDLRLRLFLNRQSDAQKPPDSTGCP